MLIDREFIVPTEGSADGTYQFRHVLMRDAIYSTLLKREKKLLHGYVGEAIETLFADHLTEKVELLAYHYQQSEKSSLALRYLILSGRKTAAEYANSEARHYYEESLALLPKVPHSPEQAYQVHSGMGDVLALAEYETARQHYQVAIEILAAQPSETNSERHSSLLRKIGVTFDQEGDFDSALKYIEQAMALHSHGQFVVEQALLLNDLGWNCFRRGQMDEFESHLTRALALVDKTTHYDVTASIYNRLGGIYYQRNNLSLASHFVREGLLLREKTGDVVAIARSCNNLGLIGWKKGDWDEAVDYFRRSLELQGRLGDIESSFNLQVNLGLLLTDRGQGK